MKTVTAPFPLHQPCRFSASGLSDPGCRRANNEDHFLIDTALRLIVLADGMGGHANGELASTTAVARIANVLHNAGANALQAHPKGAPASDPDATVHDDALSAIRTLLDALDDANAALHALNCRNSLALDRGMGTTVTGLWQPFASDLLIAFQVGDSRLYRHRAGVLVQLSRDQTLYQQALDLGNVDPLPPRNVLLQAVGPLPGISPAVEFYFSAPGDRYLLCSDGLYGEVPHHEIEAVLARTQSDALQSGCRELIDLALEAGGSDNVTAVIACFDHP